MKKFIIAIMTCLVCFCITGCTDRSDEIKASVSNKIAAVDSDASDQSSIETTSKTYGVTYENYLLIENGMDIFEVKNLLGDNITPGVVGESYVQYIWANDSFGEISVSFSNGKVFDKSAFGLESNNNSETTQSTSYPCGIKHISIITKENYDKIEIGMSVDEVFIIMGNDALDQTASYYSTYEGEPYVVVWSDEEINTISIMFTDDVVSKKFPLFLEGQ